MDDELIKELKEAGFDFPCKEWIIVQGREMTDEEYEEARKGLNDEAKKHLSRRYGRTRMELPSLSELIAGCGDEFLLVRRSVTDSGVVFEAHATHGDREWVEFGDTLEQAVSRLWLALNPINKVK